MPAKIGLGEVATHLLRWSVENMDTAAFLDEDGSVRLSYRQFRIAMIHGDFIVSEPTIRKKWQLLLSNGIISAGRGEQGVLYWSSLKAFSAPGVVASAESYIDTENKKIKKQTHTDIEEASA